MLLVHLLIYESETNSRGVLVCLAGHLLEYHSCMSARLTISPVVRRFKLGEEPSDLPYWLSRPPEERIAAVTRMVMEFHGWTDDTVPRLQRICRVVKR